MRRAADFIRLRNIGAITAPRWEEEERETAPPPKTRWDQQRSATASVSRQERASSDLSSKKQTVLFQFELDRDYLK